MFLSAVWTLILTAPIHCRGSIAKDLILNFSKSVLMKKQTHQHLGWPEGEGDFHYWVNYPFKDLQQCFYKIRQDALFHSIKTFLKYLRNYMRLHARIKKKKKKKKQLICLMSRICNDMHGKLGAHY